MKREPFLPDNYYHLKNSGNNFEPLFYEDENYIYFLSLLKKHIHQIATLQSFRLYKNSFEIIVKIKKTNVIPDKYKDRMHQPFANFFIAYTKSINKRYCRSGSLFREHFKRQRLDFGQMKRMKAEMESKIMTSSSSKTSIVWTNPERRVKNIIPDHPGLRKSRFHGLFRIAVCSVITICMLSSFRSVKVSSKSFKIKDTIPQFLYSVFPKLKETAGKDSLFFAYEPFYDEEDGQYLVAGDFMKHGQFNAISASAKDSLMVFYEYQNASWNIIGTEKLCGFDQMEFEDLTGDGQKEILAVSGPNMNGNRSYTIYLKSAISGNVHEAGGFFGRYEVFSATKLKYIYEGSWYADYIQTLYEWREEHLIPVRSVSVGLKNADGRHSGQWIKFERNPALGTNTLVEVFKETYRENSQKHNYIVNHIFDDNFHFR
ncbi:hypothetical protein [Flavobacterium silvaticum]|uniref:VCBS repeat-containing protein n=1 Tax=Flavobacterium silvaticum TaxID=1852020 RepID=A0A972FKQ7_9FLAO|nr:hypothetical protein [Flavobacterium silvaticum]NMH27025.1 hypothetical protein [Flavobacterium silvaticum]